jgi:hypothetical protein
MRRITTTLALTVGCVSGIAIGSVAPLRAQYYYPPRTGYGGYGSPYPHAYVPGYFWFSSDPCADPVQASLQGGNCAPNQGSWWRMTHTQSGPGYSYYRRY